MVRLIVSLLVGGAVTFGLFVIMAMLIANSGRPPEKPGPSPVIDIVMPNQDSNLNQIQRTPPPPPPPPPEPPKLEPAEPDNADADADINLGDIDLGIEGPNIEISGPGAMRADGEATPIVRIDPKYPVQAARDGREGWVKLSFTINEAGGVEDVKVMEAEPRRIFDREAVRALKKWKYKPRIENGKPVKQFNQKVQLDFTLEK
jgi:protein TonB